ncbi:MAG: cardiolipin synthase [Blastocatellia bacterium]|jgi:cardiolipin synthase|nr:cardiolipin synthase [Blastocatellia bacterium]
MIDLLVNYNEFWKRLSEDLASAQRSVFVQTFAFEGDAVGKQLSAALLSSTAKDKRVLADSFTRMVLSDRFRYSPANFFDEELRHEARETAAMMSELRGAGVGIRFTNPYGLSPRRILSRNHKKLIVLDDKTAYIGGINFSEHNASWHDMMLRIEDETVARFLREDFLATWDGRDRVAQRQFDGLEIFTADGRANRAAFQRVLDLIDGAAQSIFVESPYITFPFYDRLRAATRRGIAVKIVTPEQNNWRFFANYARLESARSEIDLRLFQGGMSHLKAMLIDGEHLIAGSSNFDYLSYRIHQELIAIITNPQVVADFSRRVLAPDLANARTVKCTASTLSKQWLSWKMKILDAAMEVLT